MIAFDCPGCGHTLRVKDELAGKKGKCPRCGAGVRVPGAGASAGDDATLPPSQPGPADNTAGPDGGAHGPAELTAFLSPPRGPGELGRLGPYRVLAVLGCGGMGVVYKAEDPQLARPVALKAMLPGLAASPQARERFLREARAAAAVKHDHVVTIYQVGEDRGVPFLAMEFLEGQALDARLRREGRLPVVEVLRVGREIAEGLAAAHDRGLTHRDIKPANVWLEAPRGRVKILDFGLARAAADQQLTQTGAIVGTPAFMSPEQARGQPADHRSDLFSLGCVLYRMTTGEQPFKGSDPISTMVAVATETPAPPRSLNPAAPPALAGLIDRLLDKDPTGRPASAGAVAGELETIARGRAAADREPTAVAAPPLPPRDRPAPRPGKARRRPPVLLGAACLGGLLVAGVVAAFLLRKPTRPAVGPKGEPPAGPSGESLAFFNRKDTDGWEGEPGLWAVEDGALVGRSPPAGLRRSTFLYSKKKYRNFELRCRVRLRGGATPNSGIQFRSRVQDPGLFVVHGPQADMGPGFWGDVYHEGAGPRGTGKTAAAAAAVRAVKPDDFNDYVLRCVGARVTIRINGETAVDEDVPGLPETGVIAWQLHQGPAMEAAFRDIEFTPLPDEGPRWTPLFDGAGLAGWKVFPRGTGKWQVENGVLTCSGPNSHLFSPRGDYENFRVRAEVRINEAGNSGLFFRTAFGARPSKEGYEAQISLPAGDRRYWTGSLYGLFPAKELLHKPDEWFSLWLTCEDDHVTIAVNGRVAVDEVVTAPHPRFRRGHFALQHNSERTRVQFRKIEVLELPPGR
jgi:predicted Ser/Thr protein kinase